MVSVLDKLFKKRTNSKKIQLKLKNIGQKILYSTLKEIKL